METWTAGTLCGSWEEWIPHSHLFSGIPDTLESICYYYKSIKDICFEQGIQK